MFEVSASGKMTVINGDTAIFTVTVNNYTFTEGDRAYFTVRKDTRTSPIQIQKIVESFDTNQFKVILDSTDTNVPEGEYLYDIQLSLSDGRVDTVVKPSKFVVKGGVTP